MPTIGEYEAFGALIGQVNRLWRRSIDESLSQLGLTEATWRPLIYISRAAQPLSQNDLAELLSLDRSSIVRLLDKLEGSGFVVRREDSIDRRVKRLQLTSRGQNIAEQAESASRQLHAKVFNAIPHDLIANTQSGLLQIRRFLETSKEL
ncbi:MarR family winged helix-turn-helix transcriptional regulator [Rhizobium binxianense]